jgi:hypothetical protein
MANESLRFKPIALCRLLNSTPLGEVIRESTLRRHRTQAGLRIGNDGSIDVLRYAAWLVHRRHHPRHESRHEAELIDWSATSASLEAALKANTSSDGGKPLSRKQIEAVAALLTEPTQRAAALKIGIHPVTLCRWQKLPQFQKAFRSVRREQAQLAYSRAQALSGHAIDTITQISIRGRRDSDKLRAADLLLHHARLGPEQFGSDTGTGRRLGPRDLVQILSDQLQQIQESDLPLSEKTQQTTTLGHELITAIEKSDFEERLEAIESALQTRTAKEPE